MASHQTLNRGFSLLEITVILMVFGLALETMIQVESMLRKERYITNTGYRGEAIQTALDKFLSKNKRLPCPAAPALGPEDANAGLEQCLTLAAVTLDDCDVNGLCRVKGYRDTAGDGDGVVDNVYIGALPYVTLNLTSQIERDGWNNKFLYAVSQYMTDATTYDSDYGVIDLKVNIGGVEYSKTLKLDGVDTAYAIPFVVLSHGSDGVGAYNINGKRRPCAGAGIDLGNCDVNGRFYDYSAEFKSYAENASHYDDWVISTENDMRIDRWGYSDPAKGDIINTAITKVGIGTDTPTEMLSVNGNIRATRSIGNDYCNAASSACIPADTIAGSGIGCNDGAVTGIKNANVVCSDKIKAGDVTAGSCPAGQLVVGYTGAGVIQCQAP